uniref:Uncharacterized protein n=1 Tax=Arion vulgaris TaxID=1028688 RepID=A0A0B7AIL8_9EUPU
MSSNLHLKPLQVLRCLCAAAEIFLGKRSEHTFKPEMTPLPSGGSDNKLYHCRLVKRAGIKGKFDIRNTLLEMDVLNSNV